VGDRLKRVLVANRGEIAARVARACREAGIESVLAYSDGDDTRYVRRFFDQHVPISSYLDVNDVIDSARRAGADAIHPGYGFLSERAELAAACAAAKITFIGPKADSIAAMGSKAESRHLMQRLGVPVVPGYDGDDQKDSTFAAEAKRIGFPVLVKASAGGGGKGMKIAREAGQLQSQLQSARREAKKAFGDDRLLLEKYIEEPRHVEVQIFGDSKGEIVHLFERDCSIQRRHQKVVEESPAPNYSDELRQKMTTAAVAAARGVKYENAGTVEFIVTPSGDFYFLEMNTRLQVEHPVTELVTGVDLVRAQLAVAGGAPLPWRQSDLRQRGHAIEVRIYAEDPDDRFLPQTGTIEVLSEPSGPGVRVDSGVMQGTTIGVNFDPMLAKLICYGPDRGSAIDRLDRALRELVILGVTTNVSWLRRVITHRAFREGNVSTRFIADHESDLQRKVPEVVAQIAALIASAARQPASAPAGQPGVRSVWDTLGEWGR
jgi:acetyl/propionyl-CoA carboxylase alpha subunit